YRSFPETLATFVISGSQGLNSSISGMIMKPWNERKRSVDQLLAAVQAKFAEITGMMVFAFNLPPLPGSTGGPPVQLVINSPAGFDRVFQAMEEIKDRARKSGLFMVIDSDLAFNSPTVHIRIDRSKANDLGITMADIGSTLALLVGENYVNRFNLSGRSYEVIPQVPRIDRLTPEKLTQYYVKAAN